MGGDVILGAEAGIVALALGPNTAHNNVPRRREQLPPWLCPKSKDISVLPSGNITLLYVPVPGQISAQRNALCLPNLGSFDQESARMGEVKLP